MPVDFLRNAAALPDLLLALACLAVLISGIWIVRNPVAFWDQFNPYLKPYGSFTILLGRAIGSLWAFGAMCGCVGLAANALRAGLHRHWI